ncbi:helix-turn-helix domain-containing protein [Legionella birminghamensis]|uniref:helix-turn-helix domain-containing protein n=1 Tax=Legionella birminghamensis TaxID=28083 RepID=UPI000731C541|nr:XRE family transcriptional regulator [Legionella birminghamensis]
MEELNQRIGIRLRELRQHYGWSLDKAAQETTVSKAMLGQIERFESSPTVATLWKIASGFRVSFSSFLEETNDEPAKEFREGRTSAWEHGDELIKITPLFPFDKHLHLEIFQIELLPGCEQYSTAHERGVIEHVILIDGALEVLVEQQWKSLRKGEAIRFAADKPHGYRNLSGQSVYFHNIIHYPHSVFI